MFKMNMMFTNHSTLSKLKSTNKSKKKTIKDLKPVQVGKNFMGLSSLKQTNGCKSCGH